MIYWDQTVHINLSLIYLGQMASADYWWTLRVTLISMNYIKIEYSIQYYNINQENLDFHIFGIYGLILINK